VSTRTANKKKAKEIIENNEIEGENEFTNNCAIF